MYNLKELSGTTFQAILERTLEHSHFLRAHGAFTYHLPQCLQCLSQTGPVFVVAIFSFLTSSNSSSQHLQNFVDAETLKVFTQLLHLFVAMGAFFLNWKCGWVIVVYDHRHWIEKLFFSVVIVHSAR